MYPGRWPVDGVKTSLYLAAPGSKFWASGLSVPLPTAIARAAALGYDAIEIMPRAVDDPKPGSLRTLTAQHGLTIAGIASGFLAVEQGLTFTHPDPEIREEAVPAFRRQQPPRPGMGASGLCRRGRGAARDRLSRRHRAGDDV